MFLARLGLLAAFASITAFAQNDWNERFPPHRIADNLYYVGAKDIASYLVTTKAGHIVINSGFEDTAPQIYSNINKLGFDPAQVKIILGSHAHDDHVAGNSRLHQLMKGAEIQVMEGDEYVISSGGQGQYRLTARWEPVKVDRLLKDGSTVKLGEVTLTARKTPGHTRGCTTWTLRVTDRGKSYLAVIVGSPNVLSEYRLVGDKEYPEIAKDFATTFKILKSLPCDIFLGAHGQYYDMLAKHKKLTGAKDGTNPFVDPEGYKIYVAEREQAFLQELKKQRASAGKT